MFSFSVLVRVEVCLVLLWVRRRDTGRVALLWDVHFRLRCWLPFLALHLSGGRASLTSFDRTDKSLLRTSSAGWVCSGESNLCVGFGSPSLVPSCFAFLHDRLIRLLFSP